MRGLMVVLWFIGVAVLTTDSVLADTWNPTVDFSNVNNPNGAWSYGWMDNSHFQLFVSSGTNGPDNANGSPIWWGPLAGLPPLQDIRLPAVWLNTGSEVYSVPPGMLAFHPGPNGEASVMRWTAPTGVSGLGSIQGQFLPGDFGIMQVGVFEDGDWASPLWTGTDSGTFNLSVPLAAGDTIDFGVYGGYAGGNTLLEATITAAVPEPSTLALLAAGAIGIVGVTWRRRRAA